jgi:signal transduction histidine kinase
LSEVCVEWCCRGWRCGLGFLGTADKATSEVPAAVTDLVEALAPAQRMTSSPATEDVEVFRRRLRRLALDVHDGPMQSLIAIGYGLVDLRARLLRSSAEPSVTEHVEVMMSELAGAEQDLRQLITSLEGRDNPGLEPLDFIVQAELARFTRLYTASVVLQVSADVRPDSHSQEIAIRSVLREALTNVAKHANAANVEIKLIADASTIRLEVEDDGDGFDPDTVDSDRIGIVSMHDRSRFLGGEFTIESKYGGPTRVVASLPRWQPSGLPVS